MSYNEMTELNRQLQQHKKLCVEQDTEIADLRKEMRKLVKEQQIWQKVCAYEKKKYMGWQSLFKVGELPADIKEHMKNLDKLAGDK